MKTLLGIGLTLLIVLGVLHLLGIRDDAGILSGAPVGNPTAGLVYVLAYFAAVVIAPPALLAAALLAIHKRRTA